MPDANRVVVGYDGSKDAKAALKYAASLVRESGDLLTIVNVVDDTVLRSAWGIICDPEDLKEAAKEILAKAKKTCLKYGLATDQLELKLALGAPAIILAALSKEAKLIVIGRSSRPHSRQRFIGSTVTGLIKISECPVIIRAKSKLKPAIPQRIAVGINEFETLSPALVWAADLAYSCHAELVLYSVVKLPEPRLFGSRVISAEQKATVLAKVSEQMQYLAKLVAEKYPDIELKTEMPIGDPVDIFVQASKDFDLLVVGVKTSFATSSISGVVRGIMTHVNAPLGLVRA